MFFSKIFKEETVFSKSEIKKELWNSLPVWFLYFEAFGLLHFMMANVNPSKYSVLGYSATHFAATAVLPFAWVIGYYLLRVRKSDRIQNKNYYSVVIPVTLLVPPLLVYIFYSVFPFLRVIISESTLRFLFEYMQLFWIVIFLIYSFRKEGVHKFITFYIVGFVYGLLLENTGIILGYFYEPHYQHYLWRLPAPFATMTGWCLVFYVCIWVARYVREQIPWFKGTPLRSAFLTTSVALSIDFQMDPLASLSGVFWKWNDRLPEWFLSVPFCNYAAWFGAFMPFAWAYFYLGERADLGPWQKNWKLFVHVPLIALIAGLIWLVLMTIFEGGFSGPTYQILDSCLDRIIPYPT